MKSEEEIFQEYCKGELLDPLEYIVMRDSIDFQAYCARYRLNEALELLVAASQQFAETLGEAIQRAADIVGRALGSLEIDKYLTTEATHPRKKKRGTKRRRRQGR